MPRWKKKEGEEGQSEPLWKQYQTDYWKNREQTIIDKYLAGATRDDIAAQTGFPKNMVFAIIQKYSLKKHVKERNQEIVKELLHDKIDLLKAIGAESLTIVRDYLVEMRDPEVRAERLKTTADVKNITQIATSLNEMMRLELGQSTQNVQVVQYSIDQTKVILSELKKIDPVFEYPELTYEPEEITDN